MSAPAGTFSAVKAGETIIKLPHPYQTEYAIEKASAPSGVETPVYKLVHKASATAKPLPFELHNSSLVFSDPVDLKSSELPSQSNNSPWARARRSPGVTFYWDGAEAPTLGQAWLLVYTILTLRPSVESFRLELRGANAAVLGRQLVAVLLAIDHPLKAREKRQPSSKTDESLVLVLRSTFWQGAGSPFGPRPVWCPAESPSSLPASNPLGSYPLTPFYNTTTIASAGDPEDPERYQQSWHPIRPAKPAPGAVIYSRWIPHLNETFSMVSLDYEDAEHLHLFHEWQNDPRVSQGWNETGTLEQHREYLRNIHEDPHQVAILAKWEDTYFAYFEVYWAKEDRLGGYFNAGDFDRGRHSLVGDVRFRGPHRVSAWWSSLMHYLYLDDPRTMYVVGEPKETNTTVVMYDFIHGFGLDKFVDLPHKRSAFVRCSRERFFQLCPLGENEKVVGGMRLGLVPKL
ncbi:AlcB domain-containing protein [Fusarium falciforme]|uniref:AlcB domain-containing protein n=1 Tax=Fusarium falciforme TaxID=195108 RepID=UPI002300486D|nr:AlcB domain-containing protein [Fusarium falciforme]WAO93065.1 AlcB domain-containing protein [Fusarium falciforme]